MKQVITEPKHNLENSACFINLIFTNQPNIIIIDSGVPLSLHKKNPLSNNLFKTPLKNLVSSTI